MLRSYAGGVTGVLLTAPLTDLSTAATVSTTLGMPDGSSGPFSAVIGKGTPNEEKVLISTAGGGGLTFSQRGYDGTAARPHAQGEEVRLVITAIDAAEANEHVNATSGMHGLAFNDTVAGVNAEQAFTNKTIDATQNDITNLDPADSPLILAAFQAETDARLAGDGMRYTKTESDALFSTIAARDAAITAALLEHTSALDPHIQYQTKVQAAVEAATYLPLVNGGLAPADVPEAHSGRLWTDTTLAQVTASDADPLKNIATITIPAASGPGQAGGSGDRIIQFMALIKGFTTAGADNDISRFNISMRQTGNGSWLGLSGGEQPHVNRRLSGNVSVGAEGALLSGLFRLAFADTVTITLHMEKLSGVNVTNSTSESFFTAVQLV